MDATSSTAAHESSTTAHEEQGPIGAEGAADDRAGEAEATPDEDEVSRPEDLWLSRVERQAWRQFLFATTLLNDRFSEALESDPAINLTLGEYEILVRLSEAGGGSIRMSDLADQVVHSRSRLTHTVSRMERRGLVERVRCSSDGRGRQAQLTPDGRQLLHDAAPTHVRSVRELLLDVVGHDDLRELGRILSKTLPAGAPVQLEEPEGVEGPAGHTGPGATS